MPRTATHPRRRLATARVAVALALLGAAGAMTVSAPAEARGFVGLSVGIPIGGPAYYPAYYPPPPAYYYAPPPAYYAPPPVTYAPPAAAYAPPPANDGCREYQSNAMIDGRPTATHGVACRQPDGSWRIVQ